MMVPWHWGLFFKTLTSPFSGSHSCAGAIRKHPNSLASDLPGQRPECRAPQGQEAGSRKNKLPQVWLSAPCSLVSVLVYDVLV